MESLRLFFLKIFALPVILYLINFSSERGEYPGFPTGFIQSSMAQGISHTSQKAGFNCCRESDLLLKPF
jgi:hypothetical protein